MIARIPFPSRRRALACVLAIALVAATAPLAAFAQASEPSSDFDPAQAYAAMVDPSPGLAAAAAPNPLKLIEDETWRASNAMSAADIQAFLDSKPSYLKNYSEQDSTGRWRLASQIIYDAAQAWGLNPKVILMRLDTEQSLISAAWHTGKDIDPASTHSHSTNYHLTWAMGCGVPDSGDRNYTMAGFSNQVWQGSMRLGCPPGPTTTTAYQWTPGKQKWVTDRASRTGMWITPQNQPTWNYYVYTPWYPQDTQWDAWVRLFPGTTPFDLPSQRPVYRFYNTANGSHFYTASEGERWTVISKMGKTYRYEGPVYSVNTSNTANNQPLYRFFNLKNYTHFYTANEAEKADLINRLGYLYRLDGPAYNVCLSPTGNTTVHRFFNKKNGTHFYTASEAEKNDIVARLGGTYAYEGPAFYLAP